MKRLLQVALLAAVMFLVRVPTAKAIDCDLAPGYVDTCSCASEEAECEYLGGGGTEDNCDWYQAYDPYAGIYWVGICDFTCWTAAGPGWGSPCVES